MIRDASGWWAGQPNWGGMAGDGYTQQNVSEYFGRRFRGSLLSFEFSGEGSKKLEIYGK